MNINSYNAEIYNKQVKTSFLYNENEEDFTVLSRSKTLKIMKL